MKFNKKSLIRLAVLSSMLGLNGLCLDAAANTENSNECVICLSRLDSDNPEMKILNCGHYFHKDCFNNWAKVGRDCPLCKTKTTKAVNANLTKCDECKAVAADVPTSSGRALCLECAKKTVNDGNNKYSLNKNDARNINNLLDDKEKLNADKFKEVVNDDAQHDENKLISSNDVEQQNTMLKMYLGDDGEVSQLSKRFGKDSPVVSYAKEKRSYEAVGYLLNDEADKMWDTNHINLARWNEIVADADDAAYAKAVAQQNIDNAIAAQNADQFYSCGQEHGFVQLHDKDGDELLA